MTFAAPGAGPVRRLERTSRILLAVAAAWAAGLLVAALAVPFYAGQATSATRSPGGALTTETAASHATLLAVDGPGVLLPLSGPLVAVALVSVALSRRRRAGRAGPGPVATTVVVALLALTALGMLTVGVFFLPVDVALAVACSRARRP